MDDVNKSSRKKVATLVSDEELASQPAVSGDFPAEGGMFDLFRRAEVWVPDEVWADLVERKHVSWYGVHFQIGIVPPEQTKVSSAEVRVLFEEPVQELGAWYPNDVYSAYREVTSKAHLDVQAKLGPDNPLLAVLPDLKSLLPQLSTGYSLAVKELKLPEESVIRAISDGQRRVAFQLCMDPKTGKDPRHFRGQVIFGVAPNADLTLPLPVMRLEVSCRVGPLRLKSVVTQVVEMTFR